MKYLITIFFLISISLIIGGFFDVFENSEKSIGLGVSGLFLIVFPLFSWHRWKNKNVKDYLLTKENLDKMREREARKD